MNLDKILEQEVDRTAESLDIIEKLLRVIQIQRDAIESYLEVQKFLAEPHEDTCVSSSDFRKALAEADKILETIGKG